MQAKEEFIKFINNLDFKNNESILTTYKGVVKKLNKTYWNLESELENAILVGSYGRATAINGLSDLDLLFVLPKTLFETYNSYDSNGQSALLQDVRKSLIEKYPDSNISADGQVVKFNHSNYLIEIVPCFKMSDGTYKYPDTNEGGYWGITSPEIEKKKLKN